MADCVILIRRSNGAVTALMDNDEDDLAVFPHLDAATDVVESHPYCLANLCQVVELDEL